ncbi:HAMP domain-containing protein [Erwinia sp. E_sp_B01_9]|uniref:HAMP domain-containing protein n=1 Tax=Erwinia sp. E_sp_B01_9 TaxID=3039403 RepID=UPI003D9AE3AA
MIQAYEWGRLLSWSLPVASVPLILISIFFIFRVVRPIRTLAVATDRLSRGEWTTPLPLTGPSEARDLTRSFNLMQIRLARHIESRTGMLAAMSHDLNTPLTELRLQVELLEAGQTREDMLESLNDLRAMVSETLNFIRGKQPGVFTALFAKPDVSGDGSKIPVTGQSGKLAGAGTDRDYLPSTGPEKGAGKSD